MTVREDALKALGVRSDGSVALDGGRAAAIEMIDQLANMRLIDREGALADMERRLQHRAAAAVHPTLCPDCDGGTVMRGRELAMCKTCDGEGHVRK